MVDTERSILISEIERLRRENQSLRMQIMLIQSEDGSTTGHDAREYFRRYHGMYTARLRSDPSVLRDAKTLKNWIAWAKGKGYIRNYADFAESVGVSKNTVNAWCSANAKINKGRIAEAGWNIIWHTEDDCEQK